MPDFITTPDVKRLTNEINLKCEWRLDWDFALRKMHYIVPMRICTEFKLKYSLFDHFDFQE